jgi:hypothetical protein
MQLADGEESWPDLNVPRLGEPGEATQHEYDSMLPPSRPSTWQFTPPSRARPRQLIAIVAAAALILVVISTGTLLLVNGLRHRATASLEPTTNTAQNSNPTSTGGSGSGTATGAATVSSTGGPNGQPTATTAPSGPTRQPTTAPTSSPQLVTIFSDPLTSNTNGWPVQNGCSFTGGGYSVTAGAVCMAPVTATDTENISVQVTGTTPTFQGAGIYFRIAGTVGDDPQYSFYISSGGVCRATDTTGENTLFDNTACTAVAQGQNAVNTMAINQSGVHMDFYVNGTLVGNADDGALTSGGIALYVRHGGARVIFTNFVLTARQ